MDTTFQGYHVIVEGKKDYKFYSKFFNSSEIRIVEAFGNERVIEVLQLLDDRGFNRDIGIIDLDFNRILGIDHQIDGLFVTDDHDIEVMVIKTDALVDVVNQYCSPKSIKDFESSKSTTIREELLKIGREIGYLKLAAKVYDLGLVFKPKMADGNQLRYNKLMDNNFDFAGKNVLIETIVNFSNGKSDCIKSQAEINMAFDAIKQKSYPDYELVNGHDLANLLYLLMKKVLKSKSKSLGDWDCVEDSLSLAYDSSDFKKTILFKELEKWRISENVNLFSERITSS
ncbi:DUF4435 domain-containing protein [Marinoscillum sp. 108]|uniref:DUF4435 domain-containing protein n=1 Tax=Marinoscillum sp. 108 TaxID=2653151 RepID=UPI0013570AB8|nr:DUF4435 domain-containing protein [Marinoscillum sp. 108]